MMEIVSWLAAGTIDPAWPGVSPCVAEYVQAAQDAIDDTARQKLLVLVPGLQLGPSTALDLSGFIELLDNLAELALALWTEPAKSDFLHPICDGAQQQLPAEMRRGVGFVEPAPLLAKLCKVELGEVRERLSTRARFWKRAAHAGSAIR